MFENVLHFRPKQKKDFNEIPKRLIGYHVAILATDGFEQSELFDPKEALEASGANVEIISLNHGKIKGWNHDHWGKNLLVNRTVDEVSSNEFDAIFLPGGVLNPDKLRINSEAVSFVKGFMKSNKPIGAICHGSQTLIETKMLKGRRLTSWPSIKSDLINAGVKWFDEEVLVDKNIVTSRRPQDIPAFNDVLIQEFIKARESSSGKRLEELSAQF